MRFLRVPLVVALTLLSPVAFAHKKWFYDDVPYPMRWDLFWQPLPIVITALVLLTTLGAAFLQHRRAGRGFLPTPPALGATPERLSLTYALIGLFLLFNLFTREIVVVAWLFFNLTLTIFDSTELVNHLPFFGVMALLLLWTPNRETKLLWDKGLSERLLPDVDPKAEEKEENEVTQGQPA